MLARFAQMKKSKLTLLILLVFVLSFFLFGERLRFLEGLGAAVALAGIALVSGAAA